MTSLFGVFTAFGLASSAGLNAYIPLLVVALLSRFTDLIALTTPWDALESWWVIGVLAALLIVEIVADKIPAVDSINDTVQSFVRPAAGAILFASSGGSISHVHPVLAIICGILAAGGVHAVKATARPLVTATSGGMLNPVVSTAEDVTSLVISVLSIAVPILALLLLLLVTIWSVRWLFRRRRHAATPQ
jgi:hypothetical protein